MDTPLVQQKCVPCEGGVDPLDSDDIAIYLSHVEGWTVRDEKQLHKVLEFADFVELMAYVNQLAEVAEAEAHHPDFTVHYNRLEISIWTHAIGGLSVNDFVLAAKLDALRS